MFYCRFVRIMRCFKLNMKDNWEPSVGEVKLWEYRYVLSYVPFTLVIRLINCWNFIQIWYDNKMLSSQWDNDNQHFAYIIVIWYLLGMITRQGFLFSCSCMNRCTCCYTKQVLELMQMHPKERLRRVILTASWLIAMNVGQFFHENSLRFPWHILIFSWRDLVDL